MPGTFKPLAEAPGAIDDIARNLVRHAAHLVGIRERTGRTIALALEPEPCCFLETIDETVRFFEQHLFGAAAVRQLASSPAWRASDAEAALRRHLGVCYDVCHAAVEFEDPAASLRALRGGRDRRAKLQLSAALRIAAVGPETAAQLRPFDEPVYLHQVVERRRRPPHPLPRPAGRAGRDRGQRRRRVARAFPRADLPGRAAGTSPPPRRSCARSWRCHRQQPISRHLEVETYTWDVLPAHYRQVDVASAIARELAWVIEQLDA